MSKLLQAYDPEEFKRLGHAMIDLLHKYLHECSTKDKAVYTPIDPNEQFAFWKNYSPENKDALQLFEDVLERSIRVHHPNYIGHQISPTAPISALSNLLGSLLNNGMGIYEMGASGTALEKLVVEIMAGKFGYDGQADGILTSGGTLANLTALLTARQVRSSHDIWEDGHQETLCVITSAESHYCVERACKIMGFGTKGIIKIPTTDSFKMRTDLLETYYEEAVSSGKKPIAIVASAPSTSTGMHDDLDTIGAFARKHKLWFHIDAAHGGAAIFSEKYKHLLDGSQQADSIVIDGHKMMMTPSIMTFLIYKNGKHAYQTFHQRAQYLWESEQEDEWYNLAKRTFECTKEMMSIKFFSLYHIYGEKLFEEFVDKLYDLGRFFGEEITRRNNIELAVKPDTNIVCFRYNNHSEDQGHLDNINKQIRIKILESGKYYLVQTILRGHVYLRTTIINPQTEESNLKQLLDFIEELAEKIQNS